MEPLIEYVELRAKSNFSFLTGASHPEELVEEAIKQGLKGMAITDINGVYGMPRAYKIAAKHPQFKFITGAELTFTDHANITFLAETRQAYGVLCRLLTESKKGKEKGEGSLEFRPFLDFIVSRKENLVVLPRVDLISDKPLRLGELKELFGSKLYLPLSFYIDGKDIKRAQKILALSKEFQLPVVATNDVEYHCKERKAVQDVLVSIREGKSLEEVGFKLQPNGERHIKTLKEISRLYKKFPQALTNTMKIANACKFSPSELKYRYPSEWIPEGRTAQNYLEHLVWERLPERYPKGPNVAAKNQIRHELNLIKQLNFADYFLTIFDIVEFAKQKDILCQGRGSAANSIVCYVLGITAIDPIQMNLLFERFISVERGEPPDIDIDFEHERREEVIQYIYEKYGRHRAAMISAVVTYQYRSAFREVCKAFGLPVGTLSAKKVEREFNSLAKNNSDPEKLRMKIESIASEIQGFPRHLSIHSGGFTLSADPITEIVPVEPARMDGRTIIQWDKYDLDCLGLIKVDVLSLGMLTCLKKALDLLNLKLHEIPHDDKPTYEMIQRCETVGVFQIESRAQMSMLGRLKPKNFYDLVVEVAIVRPGPIVGKMVHPYLRRRQGLEKIHYPNEKVEKILGKTLGVPLFQEQIMKLAIELADFSPGEADLLRKSINAWRSSSPIGVMAKRLMEGLLQGGMSKEFAEQIFTQIQGFSHYGFPESHAASFALLAYASSYLKCHHPAEFACSLINSQPMGFYRPDTILYEAMRAGVKVLPVSVLKSKWDSFISQPGEIRLGFHLVKGVAQKDVDDLILERHERRFSNFEDFMKRSCLRKDVLHRMALAGRFGEFAWQARQSLWAILEYQALFNHKDDDQQLNFFKDTDFQFSLDGGNFADFNAFEKIQKDYNAFAVSTHGHPMAELRRSIPSVAKTNSRQVRMQKHGTRVKVTGLILVRQKPPTAKGVCFSTIEDEFGFIDLVLWPNIFEKYKSVFLNHCFITVEGELQKEGNTINMLVNHMEPVWDTPSLDETPLPIEPDQYFY